MRLHQRCDLFDERFIFRTLIISIQMEESTHFPESNINDLHCATDAVNIDKQRIKYLNDLKFFVDFI